VAIETTPAFLLLCVRYFDAAILEFGALTNLICGFGGPFLSPNLIRKIGFILE
jgi:hypothetical protein